VAAAFGADLRYRGREEILSDATLTKNEKGICARPHHNRFPAFRASIRWIRLPRKRNARLGGNLWSGYICLDHGRPPRYGSRAACNRHLAWWESNGGWRLRPKQRGTRQHRAFHSVNASSAWGVIVFTQGNCIRDLEQGRVALFNDHCSFDSSEPSVGQESEQVAGFLRFSGTQLRTVRRRMQRLAASEAKQQARWLPK